MTDIDDVDWYCEHLANTSFFESFDSGELSTLVRSCHRRSLAPREALWAVGTPGDSAYILVEGRLEQTRRLPPDDKVVDQLDEPGTMVGLSYLVKDWKHESAMTALERTELLQLRREAFRRMFDNEQVAAYRIVDKLAEQLVRQMREANDRLHEVFGNPAETLRTLRRRVRSS